MFTGKDGIIHLVKARTASPIQRLYSLEINAVFGDSLFVVKYLDKQETSARAKKIDQTSRITQPTSKPIQTTRLGHEVKTVQRLNL
ncbi:hypothetical protein NPIL_621931 [Nephila pilipes]|uniref:Uncharacterized protein n=1 Tax=Nephila pilipes TaxID=299642 RepID=A0A8X6UW36_NEPPI|nr:hypothetical protein NPIL_621931 [Nephila pilipes]